MSQISASDWNPLVSTIQGILNAWGQSYSSYAVDNTRKVNHSDWNALVTDINSCYTHITGSGSSLSTVATGTRITQANLTNASAAVTYINSNRYVSSALTNNTVYDSGVSTFSPWSSYWSATFNVSWASSTAYQRFFNSGGDLYLNFSMTGTDNWSQEIANLGNNAGAIAISATTTKQQGQTWTGSYGFSGALNLSSGSSNNWLNLPNPDTYYTSDNLVINITPNGSYATATGWTVTVTFTNGRSTLGGAPNTINGTVRMVATQQYALGNTISSFSFSSSSQV